MKKGSLSDTRWYPKLKKRTTKAKTISQQDAEIVKELQAIVALVDTMINQIESRP